MTQLSRMNKSQLIEELERVNGCLETMKERQIALVVVLGVVVSFTLLF